jgi:hypothetical protein
MTRLIPFAAGFALLSLVACGAGDDRDAAVRERGAETSSAAEDPSGRATPAALPPCELLTADVAQSVLAAPVKDPREKVSTSGLAPGRSCTYFTAAPIEEAGGTGTLRLRITDASTLEPDGLFASPQELFDRELDALRGRNAAVEEIEGLGDRAYWLAGSDILRVMFKGVYLEVEVKDLSKLSAPTRTALDAKISAHRRDASVALLRDHVLPKLQAS